MSESMISWELLSHVYYGRLPIDRRRHEFSYLITRRIDGEYILRSSWCSDSEIGSFSDLESAKAHAEQLEVNK
jgi:hypothetical protein